LMNGHAADNVDFFLHFFLGKKHISYALYLPTTLISTLFGRSERGRLEISHDAESVAFQRSSTRRIAPTFAPAYVCLSVAVFSTPVRPLRGRFVPQALFLRQQATVGRVRRRSRARVGRWSKHVSLKRSTGGFAHIATSYDTGWTFACLS